MGAFTYDVTAFFIIFDPLPPQCHPFYYIGLCTSVTFWRPPSHFRGHDAPLYQIHISLPTVTITKCST